MAKSLQKALRSLETGLTGFDEIALDSDPAAIRAALARATPDRLRLAAQAMRYNFPLDEIQRITGYDPWFLGEIETIIRTEERVREERPAQGRQGLARASNPWASPMRGWPS